MHTISVLGVQHAFSPRPPRPMIASKPVWLAVGLPPDAMARTPPGAYPFMTGEHRGDDGSTTVRCLVGLAEKDLLGAFVSGGLGSGHDVSLFKTDEGEAFKTAGALKMPLMLVTEKTENHVSGWFDGVEPYS